MTGRPHVQRVAAYAVVVRDGHLLLSRLAERVTSRELWTLPGGGVEHGEDPHDAVVREVQEETGLDVTVADRAHIYDLHQPEAWRRGRRVDAHAIRIVYEGWVAPDAPDPHTQEVDGSTAEAAWKPLVDVLDGTVPTVALVSQALADHAVHRRQRVAAYALVVREGPEPAVLLARNSAVGPHPGQWMLPGGGIDHGEDPRAAARREVAEETGLAVEVGELLDVASTHFEGTAPSGRREDFHSVGLIFSATLEGGAAGREPQVVDVGGTTDAAAWVPLTAVGGDDHPVREVVTVALAARRRGRSPRG